MRFSRPTLFIVSWLVLTGAAFSIEEPSPRSPGFLGARLSEALHYRGLWLSEVLPGMAADRAGMRREDLLIRVGGDAVGSPQQTLSRISEYGAGATVPFTVLRAGEPLEFDVVLGENPWMGSNYPDTSPGMRGVQVVSDQVYYNGPGSHPRHRLDLYLPEPEPEPAAETGAGAEAGGKRVTFPLLLWVHGGAWSVGDKEDHVALGLRFAERGVAVALINHRLSRSDWLRNDGDSSADWGTASGVVHPAHVEDCARAFAWLQARCDEFGFDPERLFVGGMSSGGHLTALMATDPRYLAEHDLGLGEIAGIIPIEGVFDVPAYRDFLNQNGVDGDEHMEAVFGPTQREWRDASVTEYLSADSVPMLVFSGHQRGYQVYTDHLEAVARRLGNDRLIFERHLDRDHGTFVLMMKRREPDAVRDRIIRFITEE